MKLSANEKHLIKFPNVLLTGATGFIGSRLFSFLSQNGYSCRAIVRSSAAAQAAGIPQTSIIIGSLENMGTDTQIFKSVDTIIHLAARVHQMHDKGKTSLEAYKKDNCDSTLRIAQAGLAAGIKNFIFFSTVKVFGDFDRTDKIFSENDQPHPNDPYGISKFMAEEGLRRLFKDQKTAHCFTIRLPMVYGPGNKGNMLTLLNAAKNKIPLPLKAAQGMRSMVYVGNICSAILAILTDIYQSSKSFEVFNLTDGIDHTNNELYSAIFQEMNKGSGSFYIPNLFFYAVSRMHPKIKAVVSRLFDEYRFSSESFQKAFLWKPPVTLHEGIAETVRWFKRSN